MIERGSETVSPAEYERHQWESELFDKQAAHVENVRKLELEVERLEAKWSSWLRIPITLITLPVRILFVIPLTVYAVTRQEVPEFYKRFFR